MVFFIPKPQDLTPSADHLWPYVFSGILGWNFFPPALPPWHNLGIFPKVFQTPGAGFFPQSQKKPCPFSPQVPKMDFSITPGKIFFFQTPGGKRKHLGEKNFFFKHLGEKFFFFKHLGVKTFFQTPGGKLFSFPKHLGVKKNQPQVFETPWGKAPNYVNAVGLGVKKFHPPVRRTVGKKNPAKHVWICSKGLFLGCFIFYCTRITL